MYNNDAMEQSTNILNTYEDFIIEFFAYNITASDISKKIYVRVPYN